MSCENSQNSQNSQNEFVEECIECGYGFTIEDCNMYYIRGDTFCKVCYKKRNSDEESDEEESNEEESDEEESNEEDSDDEEINLEPITWDGVKMFVDKKTGDLYSMGNGTIINPYRMGNVNDKILK